MMTFAGISQPYISRFLRGEFSEMSPRSRRVIIKWFIAYKNHPTAIGSALARAVTSCQCLALCSHPTSIPKIVDCSLYKFVFYCCCIFVLLQLFPYIPENLVILLHCSFLYCSVYLQVYVRSLVLSLFSSVFRWNFPGFVIFYL